MKKYPMSFRLTKQAQELLKQMAHILGISQVAVLELAIREKGKKVVQNESNTNSKSEGTDS